MRLYNPSYLIEKLKKFNFTFSKNFGQNFLIDGNIVKAIVKGAGIDKDTIAVEIGPGFGTLTEELSLQAKKVISIEIDKRLLDVLDDTLAGYDNIQIINADALNFDFKDIFTEDSDYRLVANLPYNVGTTILTKILEDRTPFKSLTVMLQKEVAERMLAKAGSKAYGSLSILVQYLSNPSLVVKAPSSVFIPKPKVDSCVIRLDLKNKKIEPYESLMFNLVRAGFNQRRKTILNSLTSTNIVDKNRLSSCLNKLGISEKARAENLTIDDYKNIAIELMDDII